MATQWPSRGRRTVGRLLDDKTSAGLIEIISAGEATRIGGHAHLVAGNTGSGVLRVVEKRHIVNLPDTVHGFGSGPCDVGDVDVFVVGKDLEEGRAVVEVLLGILNDGLLTRGIEDGMSTYWE